MFAFSLQGQFKDAFDIVQNTDSLGVPYDYESIMHYPWNAFSSNGKKTMTPLKPLNGKTPYVALSALDAKQTSLMYDCPGKRLQNVYELLFEVLYQRPKNGDILIQ